MKGAIDDLDKILSIFKKNQIQNYYIHCDAVLAGMMLPFIENAPQPSFTKAIGSIAISGHKFIGTPSPCGVVITKKEFLKKSKTNNEYADILDTTIGGSRSGLNALFLW